MASRAVQTLSVRRCERCGTALCGKRHKKFCGATCRAMAHRVRKAEQAWAILRALKDKLAELEELVGRG